MRHIVCDVFQRRLPIIYPFTTKVFQGIFCAGCPLKPGQKTSKSRILGK